MSRRGCLWRSGLSIRQRAWLALLGVATTVAFSLGAVAQAEAYIYWPSNSSHTIGRADLDGSGAESSYVTDPFGSCGLAVDGNYLYFPSGTPSEGFLSRAGLATRGTESVFVKTDKLPCGDAVDGEHVYFNNYEHNAIGRANLDGSSPESAFIPGGHNPQWPAVDGSHVYWTNKTYNEKGELRTIGRAGLNGETPDQEFIVLPENVKNPGGLAVDAGHIYWGAEHAIGRASLSGGEVENEWIKTASFVCGIAVDSGHIYWAAGGAVGRAKIDGGEVEDSFIASTGGGCGVAVDAGGPPPASGGGGGGGGGSTTTTPPPSCDPILGTCERSLIVCVGLWTTTCAGPLPSPPPVQTCVSLFENCNGFGTNQVNPGTIEMAGFPSSLTTTAGCQGAASNPFLGAKAASAAGVLGRMAAVPVARAAAENPTANSLKGATCLLKAVVQSTDPSKANQALDYAINLQSFVNEDIATAKKEIQEGLNYICKPPSGAPAETCNAAKFMQVALTAKVNAFLDAAGAPGKEVNTAFTIEPSVCATVTPEQPCLDAMSHLQSVVVSKLMALASRKHELGLDNPAPSATGSSLRGAMLAKAKKKYKRTRLIVIASGYATIAQGSKATLHLKISPRVRSLLRKEHAKGLKKLPGTALVEGTLVPGVSSTSRRTVHITFIAGRKSKSKKK